MDKGELKPNELRIGNLIYRNDLGDGHKRIESILEIGNKLICSGPLRVICEYKDIEPIPLTEEWLIKFGFEKIVEHKSNLDCSVIEQIEYTFKCNGWNIRVRFIEGKTYIHMYNNTSRLNISEDIYYVHWFQNIIYFNTRFELTHKT